MARTPLLSRLQRLYHDFAEAERSGRTVAEIQADRRRRGWTRRDFMKASGAAVGAAALGGALPAFAGPVPRIAIIGGGIAGLNAALTLWVAGYRSTIYEASGRVGGRMHSDTTTWASGQVSEHCGELIDSRHKTILGLAQRFNIPTTDLKAAEPNHTDETYYFFNNLYTREQANIDFNPVYNAVHKDMNAAGYPTLYNLYTDAGYALDHLSVYDWIETRVPGGHSSAMGRLLDVAYNIEYGGETTVQSSLNLIYLLAFQPVPGNFRIFGLSDERYHLTGGNEQLPKKIMDALPAGTVALNTALTGIVMNPDRTTYTLSLSGPPYTQVVDRVILALPFSVLRTLLKSKAAFAAAGFDSRKQTAIQQLGYGTNSKLHLQFKSRIWNTQGSNGASYADTGYQNSWEVSRGQPGSEGILVDYTGGKIGASFGGSDPMFYAQRFLKQIEPVFPGISKTWNGLATVDFPAGNPYLLGSYSFWKVGQYTQFSGYEKARQPDPATGHCHFAGEHCSQDFQGYMEGGASEGARAANEILADYKKGRFP